MFYYLWYWLGYDMSEKVIEVTNEASVIDTEVVVESPELVPIEPETEVELVQKEEIIELSPEEKIKLRRLKHRI